MNKMSDKKNGRKKRQLDMNKHKVVRIPDLICQNNKTFFMTVHPRNVCKMEFDYCLWLSFLVQTQ